MWPVMIDKNPPTSDAEIRLFESSRGIRLPKSYTEFLVATNGGIPQAGIFPITDLPLNPTGLVNGFFGIRPTSVSAELAEVIDDLKGRIPHGVVPIANTSGSDLLCIDTRNGLNRVVYWDHSHFWSTGEWREPDLYHVADTFEEFLAGLKENPF